MISTDTPAPGITRVTIELPPVNALDTAAIAALTTKFRQLSDQTPAQGVILTGAGKAFCAGVDTRAFAALNHDGRLGLARAITRMTAAIVSLPCPLVAMVNGL
jgi:enoyl-CoA hydratase